MAFALSAFADYPVLREGDKGSYVVLAQDRLFRSGALSDLPDGVFGPRTKAAVLEFQAERGLAEDGVIGAKTWEALNKVAAGKEAVRYVVRPGDSLWSIARQFGTTVPALAKANGISDLSYVRAGEELVIPQGQPSRGGYSGQIQLVHWDQANQIYANFSVVRITDVETGLSFKARRYYGHFHADTEPLTAEDTAVLKRIYGGKWSWDRRAIIVEANGIKMAASMNGYPHGNGSIKNNQFDGHFCVHFLGSKLHNKGIPDSRHQSMVMKAAGY